MSNPLGAGGEAVDDCLSGGGEMGARMRRLDWSATPLGPPGSWPRSLKTVIHILLNSRFAMWMGWGPDLIFFCNDAYMPTLGVKEAWALGSPARAVWAEIWPDIGPRIETVLVTRAATWDERLRLVLERSGFPEETFHTFSYSPLPDDGGDVGGMLCVVTEDTARVIGERHLRTLRDLGARTSTAKTVEEASRLVAEALARNPADLPFASIYLASDDGRSASLRASTRPTEGDDVLPPIDLAGPSAVAAWPLDESSRTGRAVAVDGPSGRALVLPLRDPAQDRIAGFLVAGISPVRPLDDDYRRFLDLVAGQAATAIGDARAYQEERRRAEALAELDRAKTAFFSNVSHEFRTPLTLMLGPIEDALAESSEPARRERMELLHRNALRLQKLVNTLLDFSRIEAGRLRASYEPTDLAALTAELASVFRSAVERAGLRLIVGCDPMPEPAFVDRDMWEKIVLNLVSNAFKFTLGGEIEVALTAEGGEAVLEVRDTGTGIAEDQLPHIFERFHRVEGAASRTHEGTGIGLALVRELVKLHGGTVEATSALGRGTTFTVRVPLGRSHLPADRVGRRAGEPAPTALGALPFVAEALRWLPDGAAAAAVDDDGWADAAPIDGRRDRPRVVLADDNADMRDYVRRLLAVRYEVEAVADGEAALAAARARPTSLVLTDVMMPRLGGFGLLKRLRADPATATIPVIMLSARAGEEARVEGVEAGADDYLVKPFSARELTARVGAHIEMARLRREAAESERRLREESEAARRRAETILGSITDAFIALDSEWRFTYANAEAERINGLTRAEMLGRSHWEVFPATLGTRVETEFRRAVAEGVAVGFENYYEPWRRWFEIRAYPSGDGGLSIYFRDVTGRKLDQEERDRLNRELREKDRRKDEFLAMLAHELRNPIAAISNAVAVATCSADLPEPLDWSMEVVGRQIVQLTRLIDDLLDVSRITRGKVRLRKEDVDAAAVLARAVETVRPLVDSRGHDLTVSTGPGLRVEADPARLEQIVVNLLANAAKYTEHGGRIALEARREGDEVVIAVRDNGVGIPPDKLPTMFELFAQGDRTLARSEGGLGIGLTLVRSLTELHGGIVTASSGGPGRGSEFVVRLPAAVGPRPAPAPSTPDRPEPARAGGRRARVLVVDDNEDTARGMARLLELLGHDVATAHDGPSAVDAARGHRPEVVLLDIGLPGMDGYEVAHALRVEPRGRDAVIVAVSGYGQEEDRRRSRAAGFDHHLVKPVDHDALLAILDAANGRSTTA